MGICCAALIAIRLGLQQFLIAILGNDLILKREYLGDKEGRGGTEGHGFR